MCEPIRLDSSQEDVAFAAPEERQYVIAAAGQGKTEVLLERIRSLQSDGLNPADEVLVLSFSRAAVEAAQKRAALHGLEGVLILTFDALAARIILDEADPTDALAGTFEGRIRKATEIVRGPELPSLLESVRHVLIDEAQDLVGDRAELVLAILEEVGDELGFTVLGDPLQGIYDFQLEESESKMTSKDFRGALIDQLHAAPRELQGHYRATSLQMEGLIDVADAIRKHDGDKTKVATAHAELDRFRSTLISSEFMSEAGALEPALGETTAILASTNYEVLVASELLWSQNIRHIVRRKSQDMRADPWIYSVFKGLESKSYPESLILEKLEAMDSDSAEVRWSQLKNVEHDYRSHSSLNLALLRMKLRTRSVPIALSVEDHSSLTVSTVHRSKGLEFTNVIYLPPHVKSRAAELSWPAARQKYVALSRAREELISSGFQKDALKPSRLLKPSGRWAELRYFGKRTKVARIEFLNSDIDDLIPFGKNADQAMGAQELLENGNVTGSLVTGFLDDSTVGGDNPPRYILMNESKTCVGRTSTSFGYDLRNAYRDGRPWNWPDSFSGARITSVECAFGNPEETIELGLGPSGMWLVPRLTGLIRPTWKAAN